MTMKLKATPQVVEDYKKLFVNRRAYTIIRKLGATTTFALIRGGLPSTLTTGMPKLRFQR